MNGCRSGSRISRAKATASSGAGSRARPRSRNVSKSSIDVARDLAQPLVLGLVVVAREAEPARQVGADVEIVPALAHRLDRLLHEDRVVAGARPRRVDVVALPERGRRQQDVRVARGRRDEVLVDHDELELLGRGDRLADVGQLVEEIADRRVDHLDVGRIAAGRAARQQVGQERRGHARPGGVRSRRAAIRSRRARWPVAGARVAAGHPDVAGHRRQGVRRAMELLAVAGSPRRVAAVQRCRLAWWRTRSPVGGCVSAGMPVISAAHSGVFRTPSASPKRYERYEAPAGAPGGRCASSKPSTWRSRIGLIVQPLAGDHVGHGDEGGGVRRGPDEDVLVGQLVAGARDAADRRR